MTSTEVQTFDFGKCSCYNSMYPDPEFPVCNYCQSFLHPCSFCKKEKKNDRQLHVGVQMICEKCKEPRFYCSDCHDIRKNIRRDASANVYSARQLVCHCCLKKCVTCDKPIFRYSLDCDDILSSYRGNNCMSCYIQYIVNKIKCRDNINIYQNMGNQDEESYSLENKKYALKTYCIVSTLKNLEELSLANDHC